MGDRDVASDRRDVHFGEITGRTALGDRDVASDRSPFQLGRIATSVASHILLGDGDVAPDRHEGCVDIITRPTALADDEVAVVCGQVVDVDPINIAIALGNRDVDGGDGHGADVGVGDVLNRYVITIAIALGDQNGAADRRGVDGDRDHRSRCPG